MIQIKKIQTRFNKASKSYDDVAKVQKDAAEFLVDKIFMDQNFIPESVLDLGTGTGYIPELLLPKLPNCSFYLNDIASEMLDVCKVKFSNHTNVYFQHGDMLNLNDDIYECIISNFALQWIDDLEYVLTLFNNKNTDVFAFSTLLKGTFTEWENILNNYQPIRFLNYPQTDELISLCNKIKKHNQNFEFWLKDVPLFFDSPSAFMRYLKLLGASSSSNTVHLSNLTKLLEVQCQPITVTYKIFFGIFRKV